MIILHDLLLIEPIQESTKNLIVPDDSKEIPQEGIVIEQGPDVPQDLKGTSVIYRKWLGDPITRQDKKLVVIKYEDILGVLQDGK